MGLTIASYFLCFAFAGIACALQLGDTHDLNCHMIGSGYIILLGMTSNTLNFQMIFTESRTEHNHRTKVSKPTCFCDQANMWKQVYRLL